MKANIGKMVGCAVLFWCLVCGGDSAALAAAESPVADGVLMLNAIPMKEDCVCLKSKRFDVVCSTNEVKVSILEDKATIEDFVLFLNAEGWNARLKDKFASRELLSDSELVLAVLILEENLMMLSSISHALLADSEIIPDLNVFDASQEHFRSHSILPSGRISEINAALGNRYVSGESGSRNRINDLAACLKIPEKDMAKNIFAFVMSPEKESMEREDAIPSVVANPLYNVFGAVRGAEGMELWKSYCRNKTEAYILSSTPEEISVKWKVVEYEALKYARVAWRIKGAMVKYEERLRTADDLQKTMEFNRRSMVVTDSTLKFFSHCIYDFPFAVLTMNARWEYFRCKGFMNDSEAEIESVMRRYAEAISGAAMLKRLESDVVIRLYIDLLEDIKGEINSLMPWSENYGRYEKVAKEARLKEMGTHTQRKDMETGLNDNELKSE